MLTQGLGGAWERFDTLLETYGVLGVAILVILLLICINYMLIRGAGLTFLLLMVSYSVSFMLEGGVSTAAFFMRVLCLAALIISSFKHFAAPGWAFFPMFGYVFLGFLFMPLSQNVIWSFQLSMLLLVTLLGCMLGGASYFNSREAIERFIKCCVVAGLIWSLISFLHVGDFLSGRQTRFTGGGGANPVAYSTIGTCFLPFMLWMVIQSEKRIWRLAALAGLLTMPVWIFLSGTRQAVIVSAMASTPLLVRKNALRTLGIWLILAIVALGVLFIGSVLVSGYDIRFLLERFTTKDFGDRGRRWAAGFQLCMESPIIGRGHGGENIAEGYLGLSFHNSYLSIWVSTGLFGLLCVVSVLIGQSISAFRLLRRTTDLFVKDVAKLAFGLMLAMTAWAQVENNLASPSGLPIAMLLLISTLITRLHAMENQDAMAWLSTDGFPPGDAFAIPMRYGFTHRQVRMAQGGRV